LNQQYYGGVFRSMHRYASDLMVVTITLHMLHVIFMDRFRQTRSLAWYIGVVIIPLFWLSGITGYFLVWDEKAQVVALYGTQAFDMLGLSAEPVVRNFLYNESVSRMLFFLMIFAHIVIPALMLVAAWAHCIRVSRPLIGPPKALAIPILLFLTVLSVLFPVFSTDKADLSKLITATEFDWFFMSPIALPKMLGVSPELVWLSVIIVLVVLFFLPFLIRDTKKKRLAGEAEAKPKEERIKVDPDLCTGCKICLASCSFEAIIMEPPKDALHKDIAVISLDACTECGFCVADCDYDAIRLEDSRQQDFLMAIYHRLADRKEERAKGEKFLQVFICQRSINLEEILTDDLKSLKNVDHTLAVPVTCKGVVTPSVINNSLKAGADGVAVVGCQTLDCQFREGMRQEGSITSKHENNLTGSEELEKRVRIMMISAFDRELVENELREFLEEIKEGVKI